MVNSADPQTLKKKENITTPDTEQPYISEEEAERRTNREAALLIGGGFMFICAPTLLCFQNIDLLPSWC
jgi:hypothetical protein